MISMLAVELMTLFDVLVLQDQPGYLADIFYFQGL